MTPSLGIEPGPHWWEASALTTTPPLLSFSVNLQVLSQRQQSTCGAMMLRCCLRFTVLFMVSLNAIYEFLSFSCLSILQRSFISKNCSLSDHPDDIVVPTKLKTRPMANKNCYRLERSSFPWWVIQPSKSFLKRHPAITCALHGSADTNFE